MDHSKPRQRRRREYVHPGPSHACSIRVRRGITVSDRTAAESAELRCPQDPRFRARSRRCSPRRALSPDRRLRLGIEAVAQAIAALVVVGGIVGDLRSQEDADTWWHGDWGGW